MHRRILFGVVAWLLGAATATAGSLLAISLLGQGITGNSGQLLTQDAVTRALASESADASPSPAARGTAGPTAPPPVPAASTATASAATDVPAAGQGAATATAPAPGDGTVFTSAGGEVVASCQGADAYLISWSPLQGYEVSGVTRGPATTARVIFESSSQQVTLVVSCSAGTPSASSYSREADE